MSVGVDTVQQLHDICVRDEIYLFIYIVSLYSRIAAIIKSVESFVWVRLYQSKLFDHQ